MSKKAKYGQIKLVGDSPIEFLEMDTSEAVSGDKNEKLFEQLGKTVKAYLDTIDELIKNKYEGIKDFVPAYLLEPGTVFIACCPDGLVIRFERRIDKRKVFVAWSDDPLIKTAPLLSQNLIHIYESKDFISTIPETGALIELYKTSESTIEKHPIHSMRVGLILLLKNQTNFRYLPKNHFV